jgi:hypothetical protein
VVVFCVAPAPFCVALLFFCGRNANLAGRFAGRRWCRFLVGFLSCCFVFVSMMCLGCEAKEFLTPFYGFLLLLSLSGPSLSKIGHNRGKKNRMIGFTNAPWGF